ncbi:MAG: hypothetical protein E7463_11970 [Ruminococcaceae bacterium]|nr:hypothetical protein [Oscillospiraceae bacterium]
MQHLTACRLRELLCAGRFSAEELTRLYLRRIETLDAKSGLNAVAEMDPTAIQQAKALDSRSDRRHLPLFGLPILVKDNIDAAGLHTTAGSLALTDNLARKDAPVIANLRKQGAVILGKTNMTEFANYTSQGMPNGYSSRGGQVSNAYGRTLNPSGSSTGSAVAVSAGLCAAAIGTDTSFSIVACAAANGVTGFKPAHGSLSAQGIIPIAHTLDSAGPLTRDLSDAILFYSAMRDQPLPDIAPKVPGKLRIAVNQFNRELVSPEQCAYYDELLQKLRDAGAAVSEARHPAVPQQLDIMRCEFRHDLEQYLKTSAASAKTLAEIIRRYEADPERMMPYGISYLRDAQDSASGQLDDAAYLEAMRVRHQLRAGMLADLAGFDACIMTGPTNIMHFTGLPTLSLRLCMGKDHAPCGLFLYGADEQKLLSAALTIEQYCPGVPQPELPA